MGVRSAHRCRQLALDVRDRLSLDLTGLTVLTEAGSGYFALTPAIAALGGAVEVLAVTRDSPYASADESRRAATLFAGYCGVESRVTVISLATPPVIAQADIVTNLGFVRPIDATFIASMKPTAVIPLMCESWELRHGDVDVGACRQRGIVAMGTNEHHPSVGVFEYCGILAVRLLLDAGFEILHTRVVVWSRDRFGPVIAAALERLGATVQIVREPGADEILARVAECDVLLLADYGDDRLLIGTDGVVTPAQLRSRAPHLAVVQFAGGVDGASVEAAGLMMEPANPAAPRRMARTLAALGPHPVITLHAAGLKVGELCARSRLAGRTPAATIDHVAAESELAQRAW